ncbi:hypothetical protein [Nocardioides sp.]|nr:hypothetical protein [Nocardioides sp.]
MDLTQVVAALIWTLVIARALLLLARPSRGHAHDVAHDVAHA